jgi:hypothetical protein
MPLAGSYRGFGLRGKPDGRGQWTGDWGIGYAGDWQGGLQHGQGIETDADGFAYRGGYVLGEHHGKGAWLGRNRELLAYIMWEHGWAVAIMRD